MSLTTYDASSPVVASARSSVVSGLDASALLSANGATVGKPHFLVHPGPPNQNDPA